MKKTLIFTVLTLALTGCGDELQTSQNDSGEISENSAGQMYQTVFSTGDDITRTTLDENRKFYWTTGDQIWVETSSGNWIESFSSRLSADSTTADFYLSGTLGAQKYNLVYTGNGSTSADEVTIKDVQAQSEWDNAVHIGTSGDCGVDSAKLQATGKYKFSLKHKAAYLVFQPYKANRVADCWRLMKIEIVDADGKPLCGTYPFGMEGLDTGNAQTTSDRVTLTLGGTDGLEIPNATAAATARKNCFAVIQPSGTETRNMKIRYTIKPTGSVNGVADSTFVVTKEFSKSFSVNGVTTIRHELDAVPYSTYIYYMWDAVNWYWWGVTVPNRPKWDGQYNPNYPANASDPNGRWYNPVAAPAQATRSCANLPNVNEFSWYVMAGDPRWDSENPWYLEGEGNGGKHIYTRGVWMLKMEHIRAKEGVTAAYMKQRSYDRTTDARSTGLSNYEYLNNSVSYQSGGRPTSAELDKYFFLPATGHVSQGLLEGLKGDSHGCYWSSSPHPATIQSAYCLVFYARGINVGNANEGARYLGRPVVPDWWQ